ncbi:MAG: hypothetical protein ACI9CF_001062 [Candidatus Omnitrophota bacterium]|jgi:hypothetical protein
MDKWTGITTGVTKSFVLVTNLEVDSQNKTQCKFTFYEGDLVSNGSFSGKRVGKNLSGKVTIDNPPPNGVPKSINLELKYSDDEKELTGSYESDVSAKGEVILYKLSEKQPDPTPKTIDTTLEVRYMPIQFCTFEFRAIEDVFNAMNGIASSIRGNSEANDCFPPIFTITYDKEEKISTYSIKEFYNKLRDANKIKHVGYEFENKKDLTKVYINISAQNTLDQNAVNNVRVESVDSEVVMMIPEMLRGLTSKARNLHQWCHHWSFELVIQLFGVITLLTVSFLISIKLPKFIQIENIQFYGFVTALLVFSNLWTYASRLIHAFFFTSYPVVELLNKPKNRLLPIVGIGITGSVVAYMIIESAKLILSVLK